MTSPVSPPFFQLLTDNFQNVYDPSRCDPISAIRTPQLAIDLEDFLTTLNLDTSSSGSTSNGYAVYNLLLNGEHGWYYSYGIGACTVVTGTGLQDGPLSNGKYALIREGSDSFTLVDSLSDAISDYQENVCFEDSMVSPMEFRRVTHNNQHPRFVYFESQELIRFINDNLVYYAGDFSHIHFCHGARSAAPEPQNLYDFIVQSAILFPGAKSSRLDLNTAPVNTNNFQSYRGRALDLGQLCPPECHAYRGLPTSPSDIDSNTHNNR